jgi:hypothetical protein
MITTSSQTNAVTHRPTEVGSELHTAQAPVRRRDQAVVRTRTGSFADGMTIRSHNAARTLGSFATGMATQPERALVRTGSFADGLAAVSERVQARPGSFADGMTAHELGAGPVSPARDGSKDASGDNTGSVTQDAVAA